MFAIMYTEVLFVCYVLEVDGAKIRKRDEFEENVSMFCYEHSKNKHIVLAWHRHYDTL